MAGSDGLVFAGVGVLRSGIEVTHDVSFDVPTGQITALIGPNGAGKSSLVLAASGSLPARGSIRFGGEEVIEQPTDQARRRGLAAVLEGHHVLNGLSVHDNLAAAASSVPRPDVAAHIDEVFAALPELAEIPHRVAGNLSGGQQQMLAIGQGLVCRPDILIIDELSLGLAPIIVDRLLELLTSLAERGLGVLLIEQFTAKALAVSTTAQVLSGGRLLFSGSSQDLARRPEVIEAAYLGIVESGGSAS